MISASAYWKWSGQKNESLHSPGIRETPKSEKRNSNFGGNFDSRRFQLTSCSQLSGNALGSRHPNRQLKVDFLPIHSIVKMGHSQPLFLYFRRFSTVESKLMFCINVCRRLDSNHGPLVSEATTLPTEPQPLATAYTFFTIYYFIFAFERERSQNAFKVGDSVTRC